MVPASVSPRERVRLARQWMNREGASFPVVLKPDVGERGRGVTVVRGLPELARRLLLLRETTILQEFVHGLEFGVYYRRMPGEARGREASIARFLPGSGRATDTRRWLTSCARTRGLAARVKERLQYVPAAGERLPLFEAGFDSHNAMYEDRRELVSAALEDKVEADRRAHPGFFVGRFDVCAASADALRRGTFEVMELNGVASEPMQIYDPATSVAQALRVLLDQWRAAFAIGAANRARGASLRCYRSFYG